MNLQLALRLPPSKEKRNRQGQYTDRRLIKKSGGNI